MPDQQVTTVLIVRVRRTDEPIAVEMQVVEQAVRGVGGPVVEKVVVGSMATPDLYQDSIFLRGSHVWADSNTARRTFPTIAARDAYYHKMRPALAAWAVEARKRVDKGKPLPPDEGWETWTFTGEE